MMMTIDHSLLSAFLLGLMGSSHCVGMCGGISGALAMNLQGSFYAMASRLFAFNIGRVFCYGLLGASFGLFSWGLAESVHGAIVGLRIVAGLLLIAMACYIAQWWMGLTVLERLGQKFWRLLAPIAQRLLPMHTISQAFVAGVVWGLLPCGLVYSVLLWASLAGSWSESATRMLFFGVGTVPALIAVGFGSAKLKQMLQRALYRRSVAVLLFGFGIWTIQGAVVH